MRILKSFQAGMHAIMLVACLFMAAIEESSAQDLPPAVADAFARAGIGLDAVGMYAQEIGSPNLLLAVNATTPMNPASTIKLVTTDAALELLGPAFTWKTRAYINGRQSGDVLHGDLIIKGGGDPKLVLENFWLFLRQIRARGIRDIRGNVLLDRSLFEEGFYDPAAFDGHPLRAYNAGPDALLLNYKSFAYRFFPDVANRQLRIMLEPPLPGYKITPPALTDGECGDWKTRLQPAFTDGAAVFAGSYAISCGNRSWHVHPYHMTNVQYVGSLFSQIWNELGGRFAGQVKDGLLPASAQLIGEWESPSLAEVIRDINKYSNNVMARQLLLSLAAETFKMPANPPRGAQAIKSWLAAKGIEAPDLVLENGSGLSRTERISAVTMGRMLNAAFQSPTMPEFMSSLPVLGLDGTMRNRLVAQGVARSAHIKSGSLNEVRAIAGYVLSAKGKRYVVSCIVNHPNAAASQEAMDLLLQWLYQHE